MLVFPPTEIGGSALAAALLGVGARAETEGITCPGPGASAVARWFQMGALGLDGVGKSNPARAWTDEA